MNEINKLSFNQINSEKKLTTFETIPDIYEDKDYLIAQINAINKTQGVIEFGLDGIILHANQNFLNAMGYTLEEIRGKHHRGCPT